MSKFVRKSVAKEQKGDKVGTHTGVQRIASLTIVATALAPQPSSQKAKTKTSTR